ncbi:MAG: subclass B3 metallo-beta-lactamase [Sphingomonadales bacterium 12-68-11]|nr:MAG: subclass B3 metallo-beta-lactamase [Sphingomonadales bacterium 12-68-11]
MSARSILPAATLLLAACASNAQVTAQTPAALPAGTPAAEFVAHCAGKDGWSDPAPPVRIFGNVYQVGTCGIVSLLVVSDEGLVLIDGATKEAAPRIAANIQRLGFEPSEVKWIAATHEHHDHAGGLAELRRLTGARVASTAAQKPGIESGQPGEGDPQRGSIDGFEGIRVDRVLAAGDPLTLGNVTVTPIPSFGHALGSTSWTVRACEGEACHDVVYADSVSAVSADTYRFTDHPEYVAEFRRTLDRIAGLKCDLLITPHPSASALYDRLAGKAPLTDPAACRRYAATARTNLDARLATEAAQR